MKNAAFLFLCATCLFAPQALAEPCKSGLMGTWKVMKELEVNNSHEAARWIFQPDGTLTAKLDGGPQHEGAFFCKKDNVIVVDNGNKEISNKYFLGGEDRDRLIIVEGDSVVILRKLS